MRDNGGYDEQRRELARGYMRLGRDQALAEADIVGRITHLGPELRPLHEYGLGPDVARLRRQTDELREQLEDLAAHLRELTEAHERMQELLAGILESLQ